MEEGSEMAGMKTKVGGSIHSSFSSLRFLIKKSWERGIELVDVGTNLAGGGTCSFGSLLESMEGFRDWGKCPDFIFTIFSWGKSIRALPSASMLEVRQP